MSFPEDGFTLALDFKATSKNITVVKLVNIVNDLEVIFILLKMQ